jgi:outer membrane protein W
MKTVFGYFIAFLLIALSNTALAEGYFLRPVFGISQLSDTDGQTQDIGATNGNLDISVDGGFNAGLGFGYHYNNNIAVEVFWEYRTNDSEALIDDGTFFEEGNYASNIFYLNGFYFIENESSWSPYVGAGVGYVQEIDIDFEQNGAELSYSDSGSVAYQLFAGLDYKFSKHLLANAEVRYSSVSVGTLEGEENIGSIDDLDYTPITLQIGIKWLF